MPTVPDNLLLAFFRETTTRLLEIDPETAIENSNGHSHFTLADCRRCVLDQQRLVLNEVTEKFREEQLQESNNNTDGISPTHVQERLGNLKHESNLSPELKVAMEDMNDAARVGVCTLILYTEEVLNNNNNNNTASRDLQTEGRLERMQLMEYFGLCQASLKVPCVANYINTVTKTLQFRNKDDRGEEPSSESNDDGGDETTNPSSSSSSSSSSMMFPQSRFEYVQRLLAKGMGWDPVFVTAELKTILVDKPDTVDYEYYDSEFMAVFQQLVEQTSIAMTNANLKIRSKQDAELLNDLGKGGNTRVVSVQYSEFEVDQFGNKIDSKNNAPEKATDERQTPLTEDEQKRQLRLASEAAILQQSILGELFAMDEDERNHTLKEAAEASSNVMEKAMAFPTIPERIEFLRSVDARTSKQLAMHKLWSGVLQANGGKPPTMVPRK